jgi:hypothetical protein
VAPEGNYDYQHKYFTNDTQYLVPAGCRAGEEDAIQALVLQGLPGAGLPWLGSGGRDDRRQDAPTLPAGNQYLARHDRPLAGSHVGQGGWHQLRRICACACWSTVPLDVGASA